MTGAVERLSAAIDALDEFGAAAALEALATLLAPAIQQSEPADNLLAEEFRRAALEDASAPLRGDGVSTAARELLVAFSLNPDYAPLVAMAVEGARDHQLATKPILAVGVAATLIIFAATTDVSLTVGDVKIHKEAASPELIRAISGILQPFRPATKPAG